MGADGETPKVVDGRAAVALGRQIEQQAIAAVRAALANGVNRMEVRFDCVPNLEEVELGTALNQQFSFEVREVRTANRDDLGRPHVPFQFDSHSQSSTLNPEAKGDDTHLAPCASRPRSHMSSQCGST
jgi:hypothetical protein